MAPHPPYEGDHEGASRRLAATGKTLSSVAKTPRGPGSYRRAVMMKPARPAQHRECRDAIAHAGHPRPTALERQTVSFHLTLGVDVAL